MKVVRFTIEWGGTLSELEWADIIRKVIEETDISGLTRVTKIDLVTDFGDTTPPASSEDSGCHP